jgi:hypothetical protein
MRFPPVRICQVVLRIEEPDSRLTITKAGTYVLDGNLTLSGTGLYAVTVDASNVVIDLNGFTLKNGTGTNNGILTTSAAMNVTIQDGTITGFSNAVGLQG